MMLEKKYFSVGSERTLNAKKNIVVSLFIKGVSIVTSLVMVPLTLGYVNSTQYGIWLTMSSILSWFSFFDMGFSNGFRNRCAEALAKSDNQLAKKYVSTTYLSFVVLFTFVFFVFFILNRILNWSEILSIPSEIEDNVRVVFDVAAFFFCVQMVLGVLNALLLADQKPAFSSFLSMLGQVLALAVIFILTRVTKGTLLNLAVVVSLAPVIVLLIFSVILFHEKYKDIKPSLSFFDFDYVKDVIFLGGKFFAIQIALILTFQALNIIISHTQGPDQVTVFNIAYKYFYTFNMVFGIIIAPFWSASTEAYAKGDLMWIKTNYNKLMILSLLFAVGIFVFLMFSDFVYGIWLKGSVTVPFMTSLGMAIYISFTTIGCVPVNIINGIGKVKLQMYIQLFFALVTIPGLLYILNYYDLFWGLLFVSINPIVHVVLCSMQLNKILNNKAVGIWNE